ncbi:serpin family protein [Streptomyces sp. NPDC001903]|uniref:serpin family protein n=1 Tax=Streptomyces sp. NPDC001903 TaxID=3364622 RepID=UPI00369C9E7A
MRNSTIRAVNRLTARWAEQAVAGDTGTVLTAVGVWPLLALLADGAAGPARGELSEALGISADSAAAAARELLADLSGVRGLQTATGLWALQELPLEQRWLDALPGSAHGLLTGDPDTDAKALDAWASEHTGGLVERMPVDFPPPPAHTQLVLASALTQRLRWIQPFRSGIVEPSEGPWAGRGLTALRRSTTLLDRVRVAQTPSGPVTVLEVVGDGGVDVHLVLGAPGASPRRVLSAGVDVVTRALAATGASLLPEGNPGPGLRIGTVLSLDPQPYLHIQTTAFDVTAEHDLLDHRGLFGLACASDTDAGHFPGISPRPLAVGSARQSAMARFHAEGFEAAAVTAVAACVGAAAPPRFRYRTRQAEVCFDRPFGFLAVHRTSRLVLAAGWVTDPLPYEEPEYPEYEEWQKRAEEEAADAEWEAEQRASAERVEEAQ